MGHSNGLLEKPSRREKVKIGIGFKSTPDNHFDLQNKRLTNLSAPMDDHDATTKKIVADLLKTKVATTYLKTHSCPIFCREKNSRFTVSSKIMFFH